MFKNWFKQGYLCGLGWAVSGRLLPEIRFMPEPKPVERPGALEKAIACFR